MANEHGYCPECNADLDGEDIVEFGKIYFGYSQERAELYAEGYGYGPGHTRFGRAIGIEPEGLDRITTWRCPDCAHEWPARIVQNQEGLYDIV